MEQNPPNPLHEVEVVVLEVGDDLRVVRRGEVLALVRLGSAAHLSQVKAFLHLNPDDDIPACIRLLLAAAQVPPEPSTPPDLPLLFRREFTEEEHTRRSARAVNMIIPDSDDRRLPRRRVRKGDPREGLICTIDQVELYVRGADSAVPGTQLEEVRTWAEQTLIDRTPLLAAAERWRSEYMAAHRALTSLRFLTEVVRCEDALVGRLDALTRATIPSHQVRDPALRSFVPREGRVQLDALWSDLRDLSDLVWLWSASQGLGYSAQAHRQRHARVEEIIRIFWTAATPMLTRVLTLLNYLHNAKEGRVTFGVEGWLALWESTTYQLSSDLLALNQDLLAEFDDDDILNILAFTVRRLAAPREIDLFGRDTADNLSDT